MKSCIEPSLPSQTAVKSPLFAILETIIKETGAELVWQGFLGLLLGTRLLASFFSLSLVTVPEVFAKVNSAQFPSRL